MCIRDRLKPIIQDKLYEVLDNAAAEIDAEEEQHLEIGRKRERMEVCLLYTSRCV